MVKYVFFLVNVYSTLLGPAATKMDTGQLLQSNFSPDSWQPGIEEDTIPGCLAA